ncbi:MAG: glycosyltransferase, partial [Paracoccus sp. (in: a-proteobacteria)]|nr:glycosyltransferase [Paracoccus sp. (in: a-proteobacteria)]
LIRALAAVRDLSPVVYVDSGSTDGSIAAAEAAGAIVVRLDTSQGFTAARARNAGFAALGPNPPEFVQFIDGDCELQPEWAGKAADFLRSHPRVAAVCGRRRERFPDASVYNRLCDLEWDTPVGETTACGGDAMYRAEAFAAVDGFDPSLIAGEEPELCQRLRRAGWKIWRLDAEMTLHDAAMTRFAQFWQRARRGGHAAAEGAQMHGHGPDRLGVGQTRRALIWGFAIPAAILLWALTLSPWFLLLLLIYPAQVARLAARGQGWEWALFTTLGKFPEALGVLQYHWGRLTQRRQGLIEYK